MNNSFTSHYMNEYLEPLKKKILSPQYGGIIEKNDIPREMRLCLGEEKAIKEGYFVRLFVVVDETDGIIAEIKYQVFGESILIGILETLCTFVMRKNYDQARRIHADLLEREMKNDLKRFPSGLYSFLNIAISALDQALETCDDIPFADSYVPPTPFHLNADEGPLYPQFIELTEEQKRAVIYSVLETDIKPYIELDAGGVEISSINGYQVTIQYSGSCTSCYSATGSTLSAIEQILQAKVHPQIQVQADLATLQFRQDPILPERIFCFSPLESSKMILPSSSKERSFP